MHEISIAESIVHIAEARAREQNARSIQVIKLRLGTFTTIVPEALQFAFEVCRAGTLSRDARLDIEIVPMLVRCVVCEATTQPVCGMCLICGQCGFPLEIIAGEELKIEYIEVDSYSEEPQWNQCQNEYPSRPMC
jgi:hydrogenase nickel incorporation protein HypA/HybF